MEQESEAIEQDDIEPIEAEDGATEAPAPEWTDEEEQQARDAGWVPPDEFEGDASGVIEDPRRYLERAMNYRPVRELKERLDKQGSEFEQRLASMEKAYKRAMDAQKEAIKRQVEDEMAKAVDDGDMDAFRRARQKEAEALKAVDEPAEPAKPEIPAEWDRALQQFQVDNAEWYGPDPVLTSAAQTFHVDGMKQGLTDPGANLAFVQKRLAEYFPHKFGSEPAAKPKAKRTAAPVGDGLTLGGGKKEGFESLPKEAKAAFSDFVRRGIFEDSKEAREAYFNDF